MPHPTPDPRKSNVSGLPRPRAPVHLGKPAELDQPRLVGMKAERKAGQTLPEIVKELLRVAPMLETDDRIVRIAHDDHIAGGVSFSRPVIVGYSLRPSRRGPGCGQPEQPPWRSPGSRTGHVRACQGLRRRGAARRLALATQGVWLSAGRTASAPRRCLTPLNGWPVRSPVNASRAAFTATRA
jgi:hypothetical protein